MRIEMEIWLEWLERQRNAGGGTGGRRSLADPDNTPPIPAPPPSTPLSRSCLCVFRSAMQCNACQASISPYLAYDYYCFPPRRWPNRGHLFDSGHSTRSRLMEPDHQGAEARARARARAWARARARAEVNVRMPIRASAARHPFRSPSVQAQAASTRLEHLVLVLVLDRSVQDRDVTLMTPRDSMQSGPDPRFSLVRYICWKAPERLRRHHMMATTLFTRHSTLFPTPCTHPVHSSFIAVSLYPNDRQVNAVGFGAQNNSIATSQIGLPDPT